MSDLQVLDPRVVGLEKKAKVVGVAVVALAAAVVVTITGGAIIVAGVTVIVALGVVNFVPVAARRMALWKQAKLTQLAEEFSEETIREDERKEGARIGELETQYKINRSELEGAQEELRAQMASATEEEHDMLQQQVDTLQGVIDNAEQTLLGRKTDFEELKRVNKLYIAFHRSAAAMSKSQGAERNPEQLQSLETARNAIKTRMRAALAGKTIEAMNTQVQGKRTPNLSQVAQLGNSKPITLPILNAVDAKEKVNVQNRR